MNPLISDDPQENQPAIESLEPKANTQPPKVAKNFLIKSPKLYFFTKIALLVFSLFITLFFIEYIFKVIDLTKVNKAQIHCAGFNANKFSNSRGYSQLAAFYEPLDEVDHCNPEWRYTYHIDKNGFRSNGPSTNPKDILATGDSFTFGFGVKDSESFPALLNAYNAGMWGNTFDIQLTSLKRNLELVKPKVVIWGFYPSHVVTMMPGEWSTGCPGDRAYLSGDSTSEKLLRKFTEKVILPLTQKSYVAKFFITKANITKFAAEENSIRVFKNCYATKEILLYDKNLATNKYTSDTKINTTFLPDRDQVYANIESYLKEAYELSKKYNTRFYFIIIPSRLNLLISEGSYKSPYVGTAIDPKLPASTFTELITNAGFDKDQITDLTDNFLATGNWRKYYFKIDAHWNKLGHEFVAKVLKDKFNL
ncbi:hypothetical protein HYV31_03585 [candidate division WWE3 bacterium]|nr:hypothetical protein [candidate division WWE3 bacterium]